MSDADVLDRPACALSRAIHAREVSCREVMQATLRRVEAVNPLVNAIVARVDEDRLLAQADERDRQLARGESMGWLHGMPQAFKDTTPVAGMVTTFGSPLLAGFVPAQDSLMVERMRSAGCIVIGRTNVPEFALGSHTYNPVYGTTRNAYDPSRSAGGSSGGAAVALATRMLAVADGSDFMGSLRNPAAWANVFGLRPSQGRVPAWPAPDAWISQLATEGPTARSVADLDGHLPFEPGILEVCQQALGCQVDTARLAMPGDELWDCWLAWRAAMVGFRLAPHAADARQHAGLKPEARWEVERWRVLDGATLMAASATRTRLYHALRQLFDRFDVLALPATQVWPFEAGQPWPREIAGRAMDTYHRWMEVTIVPTLAGLPAISVPAGFHPAGWPMGLQLIGRPRDDWGLLCLAQAYEQAIDDLLRVRPAPQAATTAGR